MNATTESQVIPRPSMAFYVGGAVVITAVMWGWWALEHYTGHNFRGRPVEPGNEISMALPIVTLPIALIVAGVLYYRECGFAKRAVRVTGTIERVSKLEVQEMRDVTYRYQFSGRAYEQKRSLHKSVAEKLIAGREVAVYVDPQDPNYSRLGAEF